MINGKGRFFNTEFMANPKYNKSGILKENEFDTKQLRKLPLASFFVTKGKKYRFRVMNIGFTLCPVLVNIELHSMLLIASDTSAISPQEVNSFVLHSGERYSPICNSDISQCLCYLLIH